MGSGSARPPGDGRRSCVSEAARQHLVSRRRDGTRAETPKGRADPGRDVCLLKTASAPVDGHGYPVQREGKGGSERLSLVPGHTAGRAEPESEGRAPTPDPHSAGCRVGDGESQAGIRSLRRKDR